MGDVTSTELRELKREIVEAKWLAYATLAKLVGKKKADGQLANIQSFVRWGGANGTPVYEAVGNATPAFLDVDLYTLEEVAAQPRRDVAALEGVGKVTLGRLDTAMAERGLAWAEVA